MLVVGGIQMPTQLVGGGPEFGFEALMAGVFGLLLGGSARHGVPFGSLGCYIMKRRGGERAFEYAWNWMQGWTKIQLVLALDKGPCESFKC